MQKTQRFKPFFALICGVLAVLILSVPVFAASQEVQAVLDELEFLTFFDIDPAWPPDIEENKNELQHLLDLFLKCTKEEQQSFSPEHQEKLTAYFKALYSLQGKDPALVDEFFQPAQVPVSQQTSEAAASISAPMDESRAIVQPQSQPPPESSAEDRSAAIAVYPPQMPKGGGWFSFLDNRSVGSLLLMALGICLALVFFQFFPALHRATRKSKEASASEFQEKELFGESHDAQHLTAAPEPVPIPASSWTPPDKPAARTMPDVSFGSPIPPKAQAPPFSTQTKLSNLQPKTGRPKKIPVDTTHFDEYDEIDD